MSDDFTPNPMFAYGRVDTSAGEGGESLHKVNPSLFGVAADGTIGRGSEIDGAATSEDIAVVGSPVGSTVEPPEGTTVEPSFAPEGGTVDTGAPGAPVNEDGSPSLVEGTVEGQLAEGVSTGDAVVVEPVDYDALLKPAVVKLAEDRKIDSSGTKADIIERLQAADAAV